MEKGRAAAHGGIGAFCQAGEIGRQDGRRYLNQRLSPAEESLGILARQAASSDVLCMVLLAAFRS